MNNDRSGFLISDKRIVVYGTAFGSLFLLAFIMVIKGSSLFDPNAPLIVNDFVVFWAASHLALIHQASDAYSISAIQEIVHSLTPSAHGLYGWFYPPPALLIIYPLAKLSFWVAYFLFIVFSLLLFFYVFKQFFNRTKFLYLVLGSFAFWINIFLGQNGIITVSLAALVLLFLSSRPFLAGLFIALLSLKPQLSVLILLLLMISFSFPLLKGFLFGLFILNSSTVMVFGIGIYRDWLGSLSSAKQILYAGGVPMWDKMPTFFSVARLSGASVSQAYLLHVAVAVFVFVTVFYVWNMFKVNQKLKFALIMTGSLLISPYVMYYDYVWLLYPIGWLLGERHNQPFPRLLEMVLIISWIYPLISFLLLVGVTYWLWPVLQIGPFVTFSIYCLILVYLNYQEKNPIDVRF